MNIKKINLAILAAATFSLVFVTNVQASLLVLNSGDFWGKTGGEGRGRGVGILADSDFSITSLGIFGDLLQQSFDAQVYSSVDGSSADSLLASSTATVGGTGDGWNDIAINFSFTAGNYYVLHWRPTTDSNNWANTLDYYNDSALPSSIGPLTLVDGVEGYNADRFSNFLHPNLRIGLVSNGIPEPGTMLIWSMFGCLGLSVSRRKRS